MRTRGVKRRHRAASPVAAPRWDRIDASAYAGTEILDRRRRLDA